MINLNPKSRDYNKSKISVIVIIYMYLANFCHIFIFVSKQQKSVFL